MEACFAVKCPKCTFENPAGVAQCQKCQAPLGSAAAGATRVSGAPDSAFQFRRGQVINGRYTVLDLIGRGGMGCIYKVHDNVLGEDVALKTLLPQFLRDKLVVERFFNEARIARKLAHPNIVRVHDIGSAGNGMYISMEYVRGDSLRGALEKLPPGKRLPVAEVLRVIDQLCVALEYAHQYTIHRDIKPENVMIEEDGRVKLMDFGISKLMDNTQMTGVSVVMGTPYYMSPEQLRNSRDVDARADIYSVGVVLYEVLTGNMPTGVPKPASQMLKEIPPALDEIVAKCVDPDMEKRFQNAAELRAALKPVLEMVGQGRDLEKDRKKRQLRLEGPGIPWKKSAGVVLALLVLAGMGFLLWGIAGQWRSAPSGAVTVSIPGPEGARYAEYARCVALLQPRVEALARNSKEAKACFDMAESLWAQAGDGLSGGAAAALNVAEDAVQHYMAALLLKDGLVFVPKGAVSIDGVSVMVPGFMMEATEVTMGQFSEFARSVEGGWRLPEELRPMMDAYPDYPMTMVTWFDAMAYAAHFGKAIPTRAQWARAAYGGRGASDQYPWGGDWQANACACQEPTVAQVRSHEKDVAWSGCYDMAGNVAEWTRTCPAAEKDGRQAGFGDEFLVCGGSHTSGPTPLSSIKNQVYEARAADLGFRCVVELPATLAAVNFLLSQPR